jgi:hypothetical protein
MGALLGFDPLNVSDIQLLLSVVALNDYKLQCGLLGFDDQLRYWVKPRSTAWFSEFLMFVCDDERWIANIRMRKVAVAKICNNIRDKVSKEDTK